MTSLEIVLLIGILLSSTTTAVMVWYIRILMKKYAEVLEFWNQSYNKIEDFTNHVDEVYNMERFTGEPTLEELLNHGITMCSELSDIPSLVNDLSSDAEMQLEEERKIGNN